jgi:cellulose synthase/poly-beta-1,6-N-acetylglucosamine synthase-like glycosyltransferase
VPLLDSPLQLASTASLFSVWGVLKSDRESGIVVLVVLAISMLTSTLLTDPTTSVSLKVWIESAFLFAFVLTTLAMIPYGYSCFVMVLHARNYPQQNEVPLSKESVYLPSVTIQLPVFNEKYVISRLISSVGRQSYPAEKLQIQVLDDSTDDTTLLAEHEVTRLRDLGINISLLHRTARLGFKAGALNAGLDAAVGDFIAIFDADFVPNPDFLRSTIQPLLRDARCAWVQTRWEHINWKYNWLTEALAFGIDGHFLVEQPCRQVENLTSNFCGTCGIIRRKAIESVGGWSEEVLTEDLYISYLLQLSGWRGCYLRDVAVPGEVPATVTALKYQQGRWCKGTVQVWRRLLVRV